MILDILYATQTGNAEEVAQNLSSLAKSQGFFVNLNEMNYHNLDSFRILKNVAIVTSTTGEGDLPTNGEDFWDDLNASSKELQNLNYSVCALGDRSHDIFCGAGKKVDEKLIQLKANKVLDRQECDGDDSGSDEWGNSFLKKIKSLQ